MTDVYVAGGQALHPIVSINRPLFTFFLLLYPSILTDGPVQTVGENKRVPPLGKTTVAPTLNDIPEEPART